MLLIGEKHDTQTWSASRWRWRTWWDSWQQARTPGPTETLQTGMVNIFISGANVRQTTNLMSKTKNIDTFPRYLRLESGELLSHDWRIVCCAQLPLYTIVCHAIPRHTIVYHCILCHTKPYNCIPHCAMSYYVIQHNTTPHGPSHWNTIPSYSIPWNITKRHTIPYHHLCDQLPVINWD